MEENELYEHNINLIELCDKNSDLANGLVLNASSYPFLSKKVIDGIPACLSLKKPLSSTHLNKIVKITGSVIKTYPIYFKNVTTEQLCLKCNDLQYLSEQDMSKNKGLYICQACGSTNVKHSQNFQSSYALQSFRIQDLSSSAAMSETVEVVVEGNKAGICIPGDKVAVTGVVFRKWKHLKVNEPMMSSLCLKALQIVKENSDRDGFFEIKHLVTNFLNKSTFERRKFLLDSFASELYGIYHVKLGLLMALVGGTSDGKEGAPRSNSHVLLVGDSATGKSHLLKVVSKLVSPSIITNGVGTSDAGLTSCAIKQGKEWALEAGALVLADTGICCIDEFNKLKVNEKSGLLESMEQQTISIAKAGMVTSLSTRCSVFAAAGTRYDYNFKKPVSDNLGMSTPLISRFDLIFGLFERDKSFLDDKVADKILERDFIIKQNENQRWSIQTLKLYISQCRKMKNKIKEEQSEILLKYYTRKKAMDGNNEFNTIRMLESLVRLAESHSKLMNKTDVDDEDVFIAILLMETSISCGISLKFDIFRVFFDENSFNSAVSQIKNKYLIN